MLKHGFYDWCLFGSSEKIRYLSHEILPGEKKYLNNCTRLEQCLVMRKQIALLLVLHLYCRIFYFIPRLMVITGREGTG